MKPYRMPKESFLTLWRKHLKKLSKNDRKEWLDEGVKKRRYNKVDITKELD